MTHEEEIKVIERARQNPEAFRSIYEKYHSPIFRFIYRRTSNENLTADLCSQVFLKALTKIHQYEDRGLPFSSWLYRIAANEINMHFRTNKRMRTVSIDDRGIELFCDEMDHGDLKENLEKLKKVLQALPQAAMQLIELRFFEKRPFKEIGEILGITENNAKVRTYRLLDSLKKELL